MVEYVVTGIDGELVDGETKARFIRDLEQDISAYLMWHNPEFFKERLQEDVERGILEFPTSEAEGREKAAVVFFVLDAEASDTCK